jgi:hypothetical protein
LRFEAALVKAFFAAPEMIHVSEKVKLYTGEMWIALESRLIGKQFPWV